MKVDISVRLSECIDRTGFNFFLMYGRQLMAVANKEEIKMAVKSRSRERKEPEMTLKERRAIKREKMLQDSTPRRKK
jgi:hypothetical protein